MNKKVVIIAVAVIATLVALFLLYRLGALITSASSSRAASSATAAAVAALREAREAAAKGDTEGGIKRFYAVVAQYPGSAPAEASLIALAGLYEKQNNLLKAKELYQKAIEAFPTSSSAAATQSALDNLNVRIIFSDMLLPGSTSYTVQKGDTLSRIARKHGTTVELLAKKNRLAGPAIRAGAKLIVPTARISIAVDKSQNILTLKADGAIVKTYRVATGKDFSSPTGTFTIVNKIVDPPWYTTGAVIPPGSPKNILGTRWLGINKPGYGIHGTTDPASIGRQATAGCVRMKNADVEELYAIVPEGTEVVIVD